MAYIIKKTDFCEFIRLKEFFINFISLTNHIDGFLC